MNDALVPGENCCPFCLAKKEVWDSHGLRFACGTVSDVFTDADNRTALCEQRQAATENQLRVHRNYLGCLKQLITVTWDGNIADKSGRNHLVKHGYVERVEGWNLITEKGVRTLIGLGVLRP